MRGSSYCIEWSINLIDWFEFPEIFEGDDDFIEFIDTRPAARRMFYKIVPKVTEE